MVSDINYKGSGRKRTLLKYQQVKGYILEMIKTGRLSPGEPLPSEIVMSQEVGTARNTLRQAISELVDEGVLQKVRGRGAYVSIRSESGRALVTADQFALIVPEVERSIYPSLIRGFVQGGKEHNHRATVCDSHYDLGRQADIILSLMNSPTTGVAIVPVIPSVTPSYHVECLQSKGVAVVCCIRPVKGVSAPLVGWDAAEHMRRACELVFKAGHKRLGYFASYRYMLSETHIQTIRECVMQQAGEFRDDNINFGSRLGDLEEEMKLDALKQILFSENRPTAILCNDVTEAELVYVLAGQLGFSVPEDLTVVGLGGAHNSGVIRERITSIDAQAANIGQVACELLDDMNRGRLPLKNNKVVMLDFDLYEGQTVGSPKG